MTSTPEVAAVLHRLRFKRLLTSRDLPKPAKGICKWCGALKPKGRRVWCSDECYNEFAVRCFSGHASFLIYKQEKGICQFCGIDVGYITEWLQKINFERWQGSWCNPSRLYYKDIPYRQQWGPWWTNNYQLWEADHIVAVKDGGGCCGLENYRLLCLRCHKERTKQWHQNRRNCSQHSVRESDR